MEVALLVGEEAFLDILEAHSLTFMIQCVLSELTAEGENYQGTVEEEGSSSMPEKDKMMRGPLVRFRSLQSQLRKLKFFLLNLKIRIL